MVDQLEEDLGASWSWGPSEVDFCKDCGPSNCPRPAFHWGAGVVPGGCLIWRLRGSGERCPHSSAGGWTVYVWGGVVPQP